MSPKKVLRQVIKDRRDSLDKESREHKALAIKQKLFGLPEFAGAGVVMFFANFGSEVPTYLMMEEAIKMGKRVVLPITDVKAKRLELREVKDLANLRIGKYGIPEPDPEHTDLFDAGLVDLVIVPGVVFDRCGNRIGYGGGYYDRFLSDIDPSVPRVSIAFELQVVEEIPSEEHDLPVDKVITEERVVDACENRVRDLG